MLKAQTKAIAIDYRQAEETDIDSLVNFTQKIHHHEDDGKIPIHKNFLINLKTWLQTEINNPQSLIILACDEQRPIAFILATSVINDNGFLEHPIKGIIQLLWVEIDQRGKGIADNLVAQVEACFQDNQIPYIECSYTTNNSLGAQFWNKKGYLKSSITARKIL